MGYDGHATVAIGLHIKAENLHEEVLDRHKEHPVSEGDNYCSECGSSAFEKRRKPIDGYDETTDMVCGWEVLRTQIDPARCFLVAMSEKTGSTRNTSNSDFPSMAASVKLNIEPAKIDKIRAEMKRDLEPLGFWNDHNFGIYAINTSGG